MVVPICKVCNRRHSEYQVHDFTSPVETDPIFPSPIDLGENALAVIRRQMRKSVVPGFGVGAVPPVDEPWNDPARMDDWFRRSMRWPEEKK